MTTNTSPKDKSTNTPAHQATHSLRPALKKRHSGGPRIPKLTPLTPKTTPAKSQQRGTHSRASSRGSVAAVNSVDDDDDDSSGAMTGASFLQYCAFCEKQIEVPDSSILYCSERCRKQDTKSAHTYELFTQDTPSPFPSSTRSRSQPDLPIHDIIPQLLPSIFSRPSTGSQSSDPTNIQHQHDKHDDHNVADTDVDATARLYDSKPYPVITPALSTASTSLSTTAGTNPYSPSAHFARPFDRRWGTSISTKSIDLVTPVTVPQPFTAVSGSVNPMGDVRRKSEGFIGVPTHYPKESSLYEKKRDIKSAGVSPESGSLRQLFSR